jgi:putative salt-induced outer membrane protein YdiY
MKYYYIGGYAGNKELYEKRITPIFEDMAHAMAYKSAYQRFSLSLTEGKLITKNMDIKYIAKKGNSTRESYIRSFIKLAFADASNVREFYTIFSNTLENHCRSANKFHQDTSLFYKFQKTDKQGCTDDEFFDMTEGFIVYNSPKTFKIICKITDD